MQVRSIRTGKITPYTQTLYQILDAHLGPLQEGSVLAITSKIVSLCEGRVLKIAEEWDEATKAKKKEELVEAEANWYLDPLPNLAHHTYITIKNDTLIANAGVDESNGGGYFTLWPENSQKTANEVRAYLKKRFSLKELGIIIVDSKHSPLKRGSTGVAIGYSGFKAIKNYVGKPDVFEYELKITTASILEGLAAASVLAMGEGSEQTPLAVIDDVPFVEFQKRNPTREESKYLKISVKEDLYSQALNAVKWKKGGGGWKNLNGK